MTIANWVELITAVLAVIGGGIGVWCKFRPQGNGAKTSKNSTNQKSSAGGVNILVSGGSSISLGNGSASPNSKSQDPTEIAASDLNTISQNDNGEFEAIKLHNVYTSLFAEESQLKTERIVITKQSQSKIEGYVELNEKDNHGNIVSTLTYSLTGLFANRVLTAEYLSKESRVDERGAINLKLISSDILSGFCSFSKLSSQVDDEIRVSPYVWVAGENVDLLDGTYDFCTECYKEKAVCCCASEEIDMPLFLEAESALIRSKLSNKQRSLKTYSQNLPAPYHESNIRQILRAALKTPIGECKSKCHFFDLDSKRCRIYAGRPIDCRLFPFDIKLSKNKSEYVIGYYPDLCERELPDFTIMKKHAHILRPYFFLLYPYLHIITSDVVCERLKNADFKEIASFKDFIF